VSSAFACNLAVFTPAQRERLRTLVHEVFTACRDAEELPDGYRLRFPAEPLGAAAQTAATLPVVLTEWITLERLCCPSITFAIEFEEEQGPIAVRMTGRPGIKAFLLAEFAGRIADKLPPARGPFHRA
jgi:hypothetical protein